jgi:hypothetical protein
VCVNAKPIPEYAAATLPLQPSHHHQLDLSETHQTNCYR